MILKLDDGRRYHFPCDDDVMRVSVSWPVGDSGMADELRRKAHMDAATLQPTAMCIGTQTITTSLIVTEWQVLAYEGTYESI